MKSICILFVLLFSVTSYSQSTAIDFKNKYEEFDYYAKPSTKNDLSKHFKRKINTSLLADITFKDTIESQKRIFLTFVLRNNKMQVQKVNSPYSELNNSIKQAFRKYDIKKLNLKDRSPLNLYTLQVISRKNNKTVINASTNLVNDRFPVFAGCESISSYSRMKSCINKQLQSHIIKHISPEEIKKAKVIGLVELYPRFLIDKHGTIKNVNSKAPTPNLTKELNRVVALFPKPILPAKRNGKFTDLFYKGYVSLYIESADGAYEQHVVKNKDTLLSGDNDLALHFKKHISEKELKAISFPYRQKGVSMRFSLDKKGNIIDLKATVKDESTNARLVHVFKKFPIEKLHIKSDDPLEMYAFNIITRINNKNIIQCHSKPVIEKFPVFKGCEKSKNPKAMKQCFSTKVGQIIKREFDTNLRHKTNLRGRIRTHSIFQVDTTGHIINTKVRAPNPYLANEIKNIIEKIPRAIQPGYQNGKPVRVPYAIPIIFDIRTNKPKKDNPYKTLEQRSGF